MQFSHVNVFYVVAQIAERAKKGESKGRRAK